MTKEQILDDLKYAREIAQEGRHAPLLGGRIGLMWGCLLVPTLLIVGLTLMGKLGLSSNAIGAVWMVFGITGGILTAVLSRSIKKRPGATSIGNQVEQASWGATTLLLFGVSLSVVFAVLVQGKPFWLYDIVMAIAFGTYAVNYFILIKITRDKTLYLPMFISFGLMVFTIVFLGEPFVYLVAAVGIIFTAIIPSLTHLKNEPKNV